MTRVAVIAVIVFLVAGVGVALWLKVSEPSRPTATRDFFVVPQDYETTGGQQMRPRWSEPREDEDASLAD